MIIESLRIIFFVRRKAVVTRLDAKHFDIVLQKKKKEKPQKKGGGQHFLQRSSQHTFEEDNVAGMSRLQSKRFKDYSPNMKESLGRSKCLFFAKKNGGLY